MSAAALLEHRRPLVGVARLQPSKARVRGVDGALAVGRGAEGHGPHDLLGGRIHDVPGAAVRGIHPRAVDVLLV